MATSVASEETERRKRECMRLQESLLIAEEDCRVLRNREISLLEEMAKKEEEFIEKLITLQEEKIELKCENWSLREQLSRWNNKYDQEIKKDVDVGLQSYHDSKAYTGRIPSTEEMGCALKRAEELKSKLSCHPSFIKKAVLSHVSSGFWFAIPSYFCKKYLPLNKMRMVLEDEKAVNYDVIFIGSQYALSGGWRRFALDHNLEYGDVLVFELTEPARFKIFIMKAKTESSEDT